MTIALKLFELVDGKTRQISFSPAVWRAKFALHYKSVPYESVPLTFLEIPTTIPSMCKNLSNPTVPTLQLESGEGMIDSLAIAEYLEEKYPDRPTLFGGPAEKHLQRFFESYVQTKLHPAIQRMVYLPMYGMQDEANALYFRTSREKSSGRPHNLITGDRAENLRELKDNLGLIHKQLLRTGGWILGAHPGWADFVLASAFVWFNACTPKDFEEGILDAYDDQVIRNYWIKVQQYIY